MPSTGSDSDFSIDIKPKLGDIVHERYIRLPIELEYRFTNKREGKIGYIPYFSNPFDSDPVSSDGLKIIPSVTRFPPEGTPFFRRLAGNFELSLDIEYALSEIEEGKYGSDLDIGGDVRRRLYYSKPEPEDSVL